MIDMASLPPLPSGSKVKFHEEEALTKELGIPNREQLCIHAICASLPPASDEAAMNHARDALKQYAGTLTWLNSKLVLAILPAIESVWNADGPETRVEALNQIVKTIESSLKKLEEKSKFTYSQPPEYRDPKQFSEFQSAIHFCETLFNAAKSFLEGSEHTSFLPDQAQASMRQVDKDELQKSNIKPTTRFPIPSHTEIPILPARRIHPNDKSARLQERDRNPVPSPFEILDSLHIHGNEFHLIQDALKGMAELLIHPDFFSAETRQRMALERIHDHCDSLALIHPALKNPLEKFKSRIEKLFSAFIGERKDNPNLKISIEPFNKATHEAFDELIAEIFYTTEI